MFIMGNQQKEEKVIEELEEEGELKKDSQKGGKNLKTKGRDKEYNWVLNKECELSLHISIYLISQLHVTTKFY